MKIICSAATLFWSIQAAALEGSCTAGPISVGYDIPGHDLTQITAAHDAASCGAACCANGLCEAFVFSPAAPNNIGKCVKGEPCCFLKGEAAKQSSSPLLPLLSSGYSIRPPARQLWNFTTSSPVVSTPVIASNMVIVGDNNGVLHALDTSSGAEKWFLQTKGPIQTTPTVSDNAIYFGNLDGFFSSVSTAGKVIWTAQISTAIVSVPVTSATTVFVGGDDQMLYAVKKSDGTVLWSTQTMFPIDSNPALSADETAVFIGSFGKTLTSYDAATGKVLWTYETLASTSSPVVRDNTVFVVSSDGVFHGVSAKTGEQLFNSTFGGISPESMTAPVIFEDTVVASVSSMIYGLSMTDGSTQWSENYGTDVTSLHVDGSSLFCAGAGSIHSFVVNNDTVTEAWSTAASANNAGLTTSQGVVFYGSEDLHVYALVFTSKDQHSLR